MVKHTQIICLLLATNCLSGYDHFVGLELKGLISYFYEEIGELLSKYLAELNPSVFSDH